jgi:arsenate reductase
MIKVLFICVENSNRSQMAEAFAKIHGRQIVEAYSAGSKPSGIVNPKAIKAMGELGYDLTSHKSLSASEFSDTEMDYVVGMGCSDECPFVPAKNRLEWTISDPRNLEGAAFNQVRDELEREVKGLLSIIQ